MMPVPRVVDSVTAGIATAQLRAPTVDRQFCGQSGSYGVMIVMVGCDFNEPAASVDRTFGFFGIVRETGNLEGRYGVGTHPALYGGSLLDGM